MYIPVSFFGAGQGCITATGGVTGSYISGGVLWKYHQFDANTFTTSSFNVLSGSNLNGKLLIVGGGGSGGAGVGSGGATGGGGAGGVVYYDQFPIITGSYQVVVGRGGEGVYGYALVGTYIANVGLNGTTSSVQFPYGAYPPFTSSLLTAYGGGGGGVAGLGVTASNGVVAGQGGASGGGNAQGQASAGYLPSLDSSSCIAGYGDIYNGPQGNFGGSIPQDVYLGFNTGYMITGGGGAGAPSLSVLYNSGSNGSPAKSDGGIGRLFDITGTPSYYAGGAGGSSSVYGASNNGLGANNWGGGGKGRLTYSPNPSIYSDSGVGGVVIFAYPLCPFSNDCTTYTGTAAAAGATLTYINCYTNVTTSVDINPYESASVCSRPFVQYPYITGTGATLVSGAACTNNNPPVQCDYCIDSATGSVVTLPASSSYNYIVTFSGNLPTPPNYPAGGTVYYVNNDGISSSATYTYPSVGSNPLTVCARPTTPLTFSLQSGASVSVATGSVCGRYCTAPYINTVLCEKYYGYNITKCGTTSSYDIKSYQSASIGRVFSSTAIFPYSASCYSIASIIPATLGQQLINITSSYADCNTCTASFATRYNVTNCNSTQSLVVSLYPYTSYANNTIFNTNHPSMSSNCWTINSQTTATASYYDVNVISTFNNCTECTSSFICLPQTASTLPADLYWNSQLSSSYIFTSNSVNNLFDGISAGTGATLDGAFIGTWNTSSLAWDGQINLVDDGGNNTAYGTWFFLVKFNTIGSQMELLGSATNLRFVGVSPTGYLKIQGGVFEQISNLNVTASSDYNTDYNVWVWERTSPTSSQFRYDGDNFATAYPTPIGGTAYVGLSTMNEVCKAVGSVRAVAAYNITSSVDASVRMSQGTMLNIANGMKNNLNAC